EAWRLGPRAPVPDLVRFTDATDAAMRGHALFSLARLRAAPGAAQLIRALGDQDLQVRTVAARGINKALVDSARLAPRPAIHGLRPLLAAAEAFGAARARDRLETQLADLDGRVVAQALQALQRIVPAGDTALVRRARGLLAHADPAVRSVAADLIGRHPDVEDVALLVAAYRRADGDPFND